MITVNYTTRIFTKLVTPLSRIQLAYKYGIHPLQIHILGNSLVARILDYMDFFILYKTI